VTLSFIMEAFWFYFSRSKSQLHYSLRISLNQDVFFHLIKDDFDSKVKERHRCRVKIKQGKETA